jgi:proteic killer suppression protein
LQLRLETLNAAKKPEDMNIPGWRFHSLAGDLADHWTVNVSGNWRMTFTFHGEDAILVDYQDYH